MCGGVLYLWLPACLRNLRPTQARRHAGTSHLATCTPLTRFPCMQTHFTTYRTGASSTSTTSARWRGGAPGRSRRRPRWCCPTTTTRCSARPGSASRAPLATLRTSRCASNGSGARVCRVENRATVGQELDKEDPVKTIVRAGLGVHASCTFEVGFLCCVASWHPRWPTAW